MTVPEVPIELRLDNPKISEIGVRLKETAENVRMLVRKLENKPPELPDPPGLVWAYHEIGVNVPAGAIERVGWSFGLRKNGWARTM